MLLHNTLSPTDFICERRKKDLTLYLLLMLRLILVSIKPRAFIIFQKINETSALYPASFSNSILKDY